MADDLLDVGVLVHQSVDQINEGPLLLVGPGVAGLSEVVQSTDVADADGVLVVGLAGESRRVAVGPVTGQRPADLHLPVQVNDVVVPDHGEPPLLVHLVDVGGAEILTGPGCRAVDDYGVNVTRFHRAAPPRAPR